MYGFGLEMVARMSGMWRKNKRRVLEQWKKTLIGWPSNVPKLEECPRLRTTNTHHTLRWGGVLLAVRCHHYGFTEDIEIICIG